MSEGVLPKTCRNFKLGVSRWWTKRSNNPTELGPVVVYAHDDDDSSGGGGGGRG